MGGDVIPRTLGSPHNPPRTNCDIRLLCGSHIETVSDIKLASNERFRDHPGKKIVARKVPSNFSTRWSSGTYLQKKPGVVEKQCARFLDKINMASELTRLKSYRKPLVYFANQAGCNGARNQPKSFRKTANFGLEGNLAGDPRKVRAGMPGRISKCLKLHGDYIGK